MSTFDPNVPTGTVNLDVDYANLQANNQQLDTTFGIDHTTFSNQTPQNGYHTSIHQIPVSTTTSNPPNNQPINGYTATAGYGQILQAEINDKINIDTALYYLSGGNLLTQLTRNFQPGTTTSVGPPAFTKGATFLPGGFILNWGTQKLPSTAVTFQQPFKTNAFAVVATMISSASGSNIAVCNVSSLSLTGFNIGQENGTSNGFYWFAIGN